MSCRLFSIWTSSIRISSNWNTPGSRRCCPLTRSWAQRERHAHSHLGSSFRPAQPSMTPWDSPPPLGSRLSRQDVALILGPLQKISLGKPSHDSWALQWQLSVDSTEKNLNGKYSGEDLMRETRCVLRIQLERVETVPDSFTFYNGEKKKSLSVFTKVVLVSWKHQVPSADCLQLIFSQLDRKECDKLHLQVHSQARQGCAHPYWARRWRNQWKLLTF